MYFEHCVRNNVVNQGLGRWFTTNGIYVSVHDLISKTLQFDVDGDKALVVSDPLLIKLAERNGEGIVPLYYEMKKAVVEPLNSDTLYKGLSMAYTNTTIGLYSNSITKVWNNEKPNLDVIKLLCLESNFSIDSAKTLFFIERPEKVDNLISRYTKRKVPHFFIHAKDKVEDGVEDINLDSIMGRIEVSIPINRLHFKKHGIGTFDYTMLMKNKTIALLDEVTTLYDKIHKDTRFMKIDTDGDDGTVPYGYIKLRDELLSLNYDKFDIIDICIAYSYGKDSKHKSMLWSMFGEEIFENLKLNIRKSNLHNTISCDKCGKRVKISSNNSSYCDNCSKEIKLEQVKNSKKRANWNKVE